MSQKEFQMGLATGPGTHRFSTPITPFAPPELGAGIQSVFP